MISVTIEEYEQGSWVADLVDTLPFTGTFVVNATDTWVGTAKSTQQEAEKIFTRIVGGGGGLATIIPDWYSKGSVSAGAALTIICNNCGEIFGSAPPGQILPAYERLRDSAAGALDKLANTLRMIWWIDRSGTVNMQTSRPPGPEATGVVRDGGNDDSVILVEPQNLVLGGTYLGQTIRHIRWHWQSDRYEAQIYFVPFIFRSPSEPSIFAAQYDAKVDKDNGDGTIDVIVAGRFGVTQVPLYSGLPGSKIKVKPGELVTFGFLGANPQAPFAVAHGQNQGATKLVARKGDPITAGSFTITSVPASGPGVVPNTLTIIYAPGNGGPPTTVVDAGSITLGENVNGGSARVALDDG